MVLPTGIDIVLGQQDAITAHLVDGTDVAAVRTDDLEMLLHLVERRALRLPLRAEGREFILEARAVFLTIFVVVAVERGDLARTPIVIIAVAVRTALLLVVALVIAAVSLAATLGVLVAEPAADLVARAGEEAAIVIVIALRLAAVIGAAIAMAALRPAAIIVVVVMAMRADIGEAPPVRAVAAVVLATLAVADDWP